MTPWFEDTKFETDGIIYPFRSHKQVFKGKGCVCDAHYHKYIEILYCLKGSFEIQLGCNSYILLPGDMLIINSMEVHQSSALCNDENEYLVIRFSPELLYTSEMSLIESRYVLPFTSEDSIHQKLFKKDEIRHTIVPQTLEQIMVEDQEMEYGFELAIRTHIGQLFLWILRRWKALGVNLHLDKGLNYTNIKRLEGVFEYVDRHFMEPITVMQVAKSLSMSYSYFSRFFKKAMNRNFTDYVNHIRISKAEYELATTDKQITDIALEVGFTTSSYFTEQFKHFNGVTPKMYRRKFSRVL